jgi:hypothetical protein
MNIDDELLLLLLFLVFGELFIRSPLFDDIIGFIVHSWSLFSFLLFGPIYF